MATLDILGEFISVARARPTRTRGPTSTWCGRWPPRSSPTTNVSVKLTALGLLLDAARCLENMRALLRAASETNGFVRIDMEDAQCTDRTLEIYRTLRAEFPGRVGVVLQARLRRTLDDIDAVTGSLANFRLCKGSISSRERSPTPIRRSSATTSRGRSSAMFERKAYVGIATHDERVVWEALRLIRRFGLTPSQYEFQMLLGVEEELRSILLKAGHRLRVYVPYGEEWYAYSVRRLRESPRSRGTRSGRCYADAQRVHHETAEVGRGRDEHDTHDETRGVEAAKAMGRPAASPRLHQEQRDENAERQEPETLVIVDGVRRGRAQGERVLGEEAGDDRRNERHRAQHDQRASESCRGLVMPADSVRLDEPAHRSETRPLRERRAGWMRCSTLLLPATRSD